MSILPDDATFTVGITNVQIVAMTEYTTPLFGKVGKEIKNHSSEVTSIVKARQVLLNNQPFQRGDQQVYLTIGVGGNIWTTFPTFFDIDYDG